MKLKKRHFVYILILPVVLPIIYHTMYYFPAKHDFFVAQITIGELLEYTGTIIGSIFLFFTVYLTIRNTRKDSKIEKIRDALSDYLSLLSPYFTAGLLKITDPNEIYLTLKNFIDEENKKYQTLSLYLSKEDKELLKTQYDSYRVIMLANQVNISNNLVFNSVTKNYTLAQKNNLAASINQFGLSVAACLLSAEKVFPEILEKYESDFF